MSAAFGDRSYRSIPPRQRYAVSLGGSKIAFWYSFVVGLVLLLNGVLASISAATILALGLVSPFLFKQQIAQNRAAIYAYLFPAISLVSAIWSAHPSTTLYYTIQLLLTVNVAVALASFRQMGASIAGLFWAHAVFALLSLVFGKTVPWENDGMVFVGLSVAKNAYGLVNLFVVVFSLFFIVVGLRQQAKTNILLGVISLLIGFVGLALSKSSGALVVTGIGAAVFLSFQALALVKLTSRVAVAIGLLVLIGLLAAVLSSVWAEVMASTLALFGKDSDLTGRVELWAIADALIRKHFWLGLGQYAFWVQGDPLPEAIWSIMGITGRGGFNFHNTYREVMVQLGAAGLTSLLLIIAVLTWRQIRIAFVRPSADRSLYLAILFTMFWRAPFEVILPFQPVWPACIFMITALVLRQPTNSTSKV